MFQTIEFSDMSVNRNLVKYMRRVGLLKSGGDRCFMIYALSWQEFFVTVTNSNKCGIVNSEFVKSVHWEIILW